MSVIRARGKDTGEMGNPTLPHLRGANPLSRGVARLHCGACIESQSNVCAGLLFLSPTGMEMVAVRPYRGHHLVIPANQSQVSKNGGFGFCGEEWMLSPLPRKHRRARAGMWILGHHHAEEAGCW